MTKEEASSILENIDRRVCDDELSEALDMAIKTLEQDGYYKDLAQSYEGTIAKLTEAIAEQQPSEDCVSRQEVLQMIEDIKDAGGFIGSSTYSEAFDVVENMPPVTHTRKTGHWIMTSDYITAAYGSIHYVKCSCCGEDSLEEGDFCTNCGAKMEM